MASASETLAAPQDALTSAEAPPSCGREAELRRPVSKEAVGGWLEEEEEAQGGPPPFVSSF